MSHFAMNRRLFLRGAAGITVALPFVHTLFFGRNAVAGPPKPPKRSGVIKRPTARRCSTTPA